jgi:hypothetical protein
MPRHDDPSIPDDAVLIRAVHPDWLEEKDGTERITSATFLSGQAEASCFIGSEVGELQGFRENILPELRALLKIDIQALAVISARAVRDAGLWVYRKPEEFRGNNAHVVICPPDGMSRNQYTKRAKSLAPQAYKFPARDNDAPE